MYLRGIKRAARPDRAEARLAPDALRDGAARVSGPASEPASEPASGPSGGAIFAAGADSAVAGRKQRNMQRRYNQECSVAYALDLLGERWTLLIVRQLLLGPQRFAELLDALSGIGPNLLTKRLRKLEDARLVRKTDEGDRFSRYQLTPHGERIRPILRELVRWSIGLLYTNEDPPPDRPKPPATDEILCDTFMLLIEAFAQTEHLGDHDFICRFDVEDKEYTVFYTEGRLTTRRGALAPARASVKTDRATVRQILERRLSVEDALERGCVREEGDLALLDRINRALLAGRDRHSARSAENV